VQADGGTLFLDETGDMPLQLQAKLLRVLEDGRVTSVGGSSDKIVDVRVVAATNIDLRSKVEQKTFRQDLYYRLSGYVVNLPPLRKRIEDVIPLTTHFLTLLAEQMGRMVSPISAQAIEVLQRYHFPGNVRELKNLIEHSLIASRGQTILPEHFHFIHQIALEGESPAQQSQNTSPHNPAPQHQTNQPVPADVPPVRIKQQDEQLILGYVKEHGRIDNSVAQKVLNIEHGRASYLLKKLHGEGKLNREGQRRWAFYTLAE
jgi:transcriptional regulator with PAS, ATPase and Fis domain